jgi:hypothetical protein
MLILCTVLVFRQEFTLEDAIGSHTCSLGAFCMRVANVIPLKRVTPLAVTTVKSAQPLKVTATQANATLTLTLTINSAQTQQVNWPHRRMQL